MRTVRATRYVAPLREGGSLPAIVEADDDGIYVVKFHGAGQGPKALVAETIVGEIGRALGLRVPDLVEAELDLELAKAEPDPEIQELMERSVGTNLGVDYLPGSLAFAADGTTDPSLAADIVWFDAFASNVDRTPRNPNLLVWGGNVWLIDHGAALFTHHGWGDLESALAAAGSRFPQVRQHVLLPSAGPVDEADRRLAPRLTADVVEAAVAAGADAWLFGVAPFATPEEHRSAYRAYLLRRLEGPRGFAEEAEAARRDLRG